MNDLTLSLFISAFLTVVLACIQISWDSRPKSTSTSNVVPFHCLFTPFLWLYFLVMAIGNLASTLIASGMVDKALAGGNTKTGTAQFLVGPRWIWYSFFGLFGFEIIIKRVNISFFDSCH
jgi:hypothetical protein